LSEGGDRIETPGIETRGPSIEAKGLAIGYPAEDGGGTIVLSDVDLIIERGDFLTILGPSGCGKSTLLRVIADLLPPLAGAISVLGNPPARARSRREVAFVFQDSTLLPWRTVRENVELPLQVGRANVTRPIEATSDELLALVGLAELADRYPDQLSGGQRQRVAIARALLCNPSILLMDEPFGALDEITRDRLNDELLAIWRRTGTTILFVTHSIMEAVYLGRRVLVLAAHPGRVQEVVDLRRLKDSSGGLAREAPDAVAAMARLRQLLARQVS
jgi:NitT/TauT family transport system ATP-binding protein